MSIHHKHPIVCTTVARCWAEPAFRAEFLRSPATVLRSRGLELPADVEVVAFENSESLTHVVVPGLYPADLKARLARPGHQVKYLPVEPKKLFVTL